MAINCRTCPVIFLFHQIVSLASSFVKGKMGLRNGLKRKKKGKPYILKDIKQVQIKQLEVVSMGVHGPAQLRHSKPNPVLKT